MIYRLCAVLQKICRHLSLFMARHFIDRESEWADVEEMDATAAHDATFLRFQLIKQRAEYTELQNQIYDLRIRFSALFGMTREQLQQTACRYEIREAVSKPGRLVVLNHCVFCGCDLETVAFSTERDALLYVALLDAARYQPKHNLSCPACYEEYEKSHELSKD